MPAQYNQKLNAPSASLLGKVRSRLRKRAAFYGFERIRNIPTKSLELVFPGIAQAQCLMQYATKSPDIGNVAPHELVIISSICAYIHPLMVCEFGTYDGTTTLHFALNSAEQARIITLDLHPDDPIRKSISDDTFYTQGVVVGSEFLNHPASGRIEQIYTDTTKFDHAAFRGKADLIFVDAGHVYDLVKSDSLKALDMLRPGGTVLWHDYSFGHPGVYTWLHELSRKIPLVNLSGTSLVCHISSM